jgi:hypothetical protein
MFCLARGLFVGRLSLPRSVAETGRSREESDAFERVAGVRDVPILRIFLCIMSCLARGLFVGRLCLPRSVAETSQSREEGDAFERVVGVQDVPILFMYYVLFGKGVVCRAPVFATQRGRDKPVQRGKRCF